MGQEAGRGEKLSYLYLGDKSGTSQGTLGQGRDGQHPLPAPACCVCLVMRPWAGPRLGGGEQELEQRWARDRRLLHLKIRSCVSDSFLISKST